MRSFFLEHISSLAAAESVLRVELPGQEHPWLLRASDGDVVAYVDVDGEPNLHVYANIRGGRTHHDAAVVGLLHRLRASVGGTVTNDD